ncbi:MAG: sensor histidine kinase [Chloroflexi bacterium]|jgi:signal transduction histidine kinase|nr:sensor histidine kinase [Chloroflexota bacterium]
MPALFSTGSPELDALVETLHAGDNVVFYTHDWQEYLPFVASLLSHIKASSDGFVYVRSQGLLDELVATAPHARVLNIAELNTDGDLVSVLREHVCRLAPQGYYLFEPLDSLLPWLGSEERLRGFFLTMCPLLFQLQSIAYWDLVIGQFSSATVAAIKDCTQILLKVEPLGDDMTISPLKVWGRYSEAMFRPHRATVDGSILRISPQPVPPESQQAYTLALAAKNRELAEVRDMLNQTNRELIQRNQELAVLNERLREQSRLYNSLRVNLDHLLALFQASQVIGSSLVMDQVHRAIVSAALRLFDVSACRLLLHRNNSTECVDISEGMTDEWLLDLDCHPMTLLRDQASRLQQVQSGPLLDDAGRVRGSMAAAPIAARGACLGTLEVYAADARLDTAETRTLLSYLASEASIALDNAHLYREVEIQGAQLRSFVENVITSEEQESRRFAFDLHDGLVQLIVASYQHLQTAQAWHTRESEVEEREMEQGVQLLRRAIYEARRLIGQLRPAGLDDFGLAHALRLYVAQLATEANWQVSLEVDPNWTKLPPALEAALFRIVQEATTNARKYAEAERVEVRLQAGKRELCVTVRDWGKGFDPASVAAVVEAASGPSAEPKQGLHMGLIGIRERARLMGGHCVIDSEPGKGTCVQVCIPREQATLSPEDEK